MTDEELDRINRAEEIQLYTENRCEALEKENAELKEENEKLKERLHNAKYTPYSSCDFAEKNKKLEAQIKKMQCCNNCKYHYFIGNELECRLLDNGINCDDKEKWDASRDGKMIITDCHVYDGQFVINPYTQPDDSDGFQYVLSDKEGVDKSISYTDLRGDKYWPVIYRDVKSTHDQEIVVVVKNNNAVSTRVALHAGIRNDSRADEKNHLFYPLYQTNKGLKNEDGYYVDGSTIDINPYVEFTFVVSVDEDEMYKDDAISCLEFLVDNCYGDTTLRSGNVDIVSVLVRAKTAE